MANINDILTTLEGRVGDTKHLKSDRSQRSKFVKERSACNFYHGR